eukprot:Rmarinus@m.43
MVPQVIVNLMRSAGPGITVVLIMAVVHTGLKAGVRKKCVRALVVKSAPSASVGTACSVSLVHGGMVRIASTVLLVVTALTAPTFGALIARLVLGAPTSLIRARRIVTPARRTLLTAFMARLA